MGALHPDSPRRATERYGGDLTGRMGAVVVSCAQVSGVVDGVPGDGGGGDGAPHGAPGGQRAGLLRALAG